VLHKFEDKEPMYFICGDFNIPLDSAAIESAALSKEDRKKYNAIWKSISGEWDILPNAPGAHSDSPVLNDKDYSYILVHLKITTTCTHRLDCFKFSILPVNEDSDTGTYKCGSKGGILFEITSKDIEEVTSKGKNQRIVP
jgi:hypothetical protein